MKGKFKERAKKEKKKFLFTFNKSLCRKYNKKQHCAPYSLLFYCFLRVMFDFMHTIETSLGSAI